MNKDMVVCAGISAVAAITVTALTISRRKSAKELTDALNRYEETLKEEESLYLETEALLASMKPLEAEEPEPVVVQGTVISADEAVEAEIAPTDDFWEDALRSTKRWPTAFGPSVFEGGMAALEWPSKGYHVCSVDGELGICHVTKASFTFVKKVGDKWEGQSSAPPRFKSTGVVQLTEKQVREYLVGR